MYYEHTGDIHTCLKGAFGVEDDNWREQLCDLSDDCPPVYQEEVEAFHLLCLKIGHNDGRDR